LSDHPVLVPTQAGPLGAIVTEPEMAAVAACLIVPGVGGHRTGVNQLWTRTAWALAENGVVVFRMDWPGFAESSLAMPGQAKRKRAIAEGVAWFRARTAELPLLVVGACAGVGAAASMAARDREPAGVCAIEPYLGPLPRRSRLRLRGIRPVGGRPARRQPLDPRTVEDLSRAAGRAPIHVLVGERDRSRQDVVDIAQRLGATVEIVPSVALHGHATAAVQAITIERVTRWGREFLAEVAGR